MKRQRGWIDIPRGFFETLFVLAFLGAIGIAGALIYGLWWVVTHVRFA